MVDGSAPRPWSNGQLAGGRIDLPDTERIEVR
jgi:hypothetical protein